MTNTLDLVITENKERVYGLVETPALGNLESGHIGIGWNYALASNKDKNGGGPCFKKNKYNYKTGDYTGMKAYFKQLN